MKNRKNNRILTLLIAGFMKGALSFDHHSRTGFYPGGRSRDLLSDTGIQQR
jgi:hypothetical protein